MSVYRAEATKASCRVSGCACHQRVPRYPSDMTDAQWALLRPQAQAARRFRNPRRIRAGGEPAGFPHKLTPRARHDNTADPNPAVGRDPLTLQHRDITQDLTSQPMPKPVILPQGSVETTDLISKDRPDHHIPHTRPSHPRCLSPRTRKRQSRRVSAPPSHDHQTLTQPWRPLDAVW
jgi:hypothetical protein